MGSLTLWRRDLEDQRAARAEQAVARLDRWDFGPGRRFQSRDWIIFISGKYQGSAPTVFIQDENNFSACVGTFIYRGLKGGEAVKAAFADFDESSHFWDEVYGSFCLVLCRNAQLWLVPDRLSIYPLYRDDAGHIISSSFLNVLQVIDRPSTNRQSIYEYVFQGASYDGRTVVDQIHLLDRGCTFRLDHQIHSHRAEAAVDGPKWANFDDHLTLTIQALRKQFNALASAFGNEMDTALSGGYDSRLVFALLRDRGIAPRIHVYGASTDADVSIAKTISAGEGFPLIHADKSLGPLPSPERFPEIVARNLMLFDGYPPDGIFDAGVDITTRLERAAGGALALNGGGGEIFRNFFYLPDRSFTIRDVISGFFSQFDPIICTEQFDEKSYIQCMALAIARVLDLPTAGQHLETLRLTRTQIEYLYPHLRCVYWMGRNNAVNNRMGFAATPFIEADLIRLALQIPIRFKNHGVFEAALINAIDPALARYPSAYGESFAEPPRTARKLKDYTTILRPPSLRRFSYRLQNRRCRKTLPPLLETAFLQTVIDPGFPALRRYFKIEEVRSSLELNRICTLEYLFQEYRVDVG